MSTCPKEAVQVGWTSVRNLIVYDSTFRRLSGEDMTVQSPSEVFPGVSSGMFDNNLKETIIHNG